MKQKSPFRIFPRHVNGKTYFYYTCYDEYGKRLRFSTGCTSRTSANRFCLELYKDGKLIPTEHKEGILFKDFAKDWWDWDKCPYVTYRRQNGYEITHSYADTNKRVLEKKLLPYFGEMFLHRINAAQIEKWMVEMQKKLSNKTIRNYASVLSVMLTEATRQGYIPDNPYLKVRPIAKNSKIRGTLTLEEARKLFADPSQWFNVHAYVASLLASVTGMRLSEIRALRCEDVKEDHIHVEFSLEDKYGEKSTKTGDVRDLPLPKKVMEELVKVKRNRTEGLLLCYPTGKPYGRHMFLENLKLVMDIYKIDWQERNIGFHSWRHFLNTQLLSHGISGEKTREITGHTTKEMTDRYKHFALEDYSDVLDVTEQLTRM